jgi:hypothetical protein
MDWKLGVMWSRIAWYLKVYNWHRSLVFWALIPVLIQWLGCGLDVLTKCESQQKEGIFLFQTSSGVYPASYPLNVWGIFLASKATMEWCPHNTQKICISSVMTLVAAIHCLEIAQEFPTRFEVKVIWCVVGGSGKDLILKNHVNSEASRWWSSFLCTTWNV